MLILYSLLLFNNYIPNNNICKIDSVYLDSDNTDYSIDISIGFVVFYDEANAWIISKTTNCNKTLISFQNLEPIEAKTVKFNEHFSLYEISRPNIEFSPVEFGEPSQICTFVGLNFNIEDFDNNQLLTNFLVKTIYINNNNIVFAIDTNFNGNEGIVFNDKNEIVAYVDSINNKQAKGKSIRLINNFLSESIMTAVPMSPIEDHDE